MKLAQEIKDYNIPNSAVEDTFEIVRQFFDHEVGIDEQSQHTQFRHIARGYEKAIEAVMVETTGEGVNEVSN